MASKNTVFIHTNEKQMIGAIVSAHSMKRNSKSPDAFEVKIIRVEDYPFYAELQGKPFLREKRMDTWDVNDLQSFTTSRFMPPELCGYKGRSVVVDPDVFAVGDINALFTRDMQGSAVMARNRSGHKGYEDYIATSVMLMDNSKLKHWNVESDFREMFAGKRDYEIWMRLGYEDKGTIKHLEASWNDFDNLDADTKLIHNTKRRTQPWKTGLPVDFTNRRGLFGILPSSWTPAGWIKRTKLPGSYWRHPDRKQEEYFFALLNECLQNGMISHDLLNHHIAEKNVRADSLEIASQVRSVDAVLGTVMQKVA
jgi:hypothetical protein